MSLYRSVFVVSLEGVAGQHISHLYITHCHSPPASQSAGGWVGKLARGAWRGDVIAMVASHAFLPSGDDITDFPIGFKLNFLYLIRDLNFIFKSDEVWLLSVILTYNCIVIPPRNKMFFFWFVTICNFRILAYFRRRTRVRVGRVAWSAWMVFQISLVQFQ